ncbi:MAG: hypothetical protein Q4G09_08405, partial [Clostridia bacterium]|nr:hypothetical protein [Clostridia bacterium]
WGRIQIIDSTYSKIDNYSDYLNNTELKNIINDIISIDFDNITFKKSFEILFDISTSLKQIYKN